MDAQAMMPDLGYFIAGLLAGGLHFTLLRWNTSLYAHEGSIGLAAGLQILRLGLLGCLLAGIALEGAWPLLLAALGVIMARPCVVRMVAP